MRVRFLFLIGISLVVLALMIILKKKNDSRPQETAATKPLTPETSKTHASPEVAREPASKGSQQSAAAYPLEVPQVRQQIGELKPVDIRSVQRTIASAYSKYRTSEQYRLSNGQFERLKLRAIPKAEFAGDSREVITEKLGFVFVESNQTAGSRPTVVNRANGMLGIITGTILVRTPDTGIAQSLAQKLSLKILHIDESIGLIYFAASPDTAPTLLNSIKDSPSVTSVSLEIVESEARF